MQELSKIYNPKEVEDRWYQYWETNRLFHATVNPAKKPYTVVIPPPNVTGILHIGHILNNTIQDILVRWKRMRGYEACWIPGTDHAGIATQNSVEKALAKEGIDRHKLGREKFVERVWEWKEQYGGTIIRQLRKIGSSCDWERERFTMDEGLSKAVNEVFVRLYEKGLIYRGKYIVNWCPFHQTALSDDEVDNKPTTGNLWFIKYPIEGSTEVAVVATTRPETILGDTAVCVNPKDERYKHLVGKTAILPIVGRKLPIIADDYIDSSFATGMMKVTPAHDPNDFFLGQRHNLPQLNILDETGHLNESVPKQYEGMDRFKCRKQIVKDLEASGNLLKVERYDHNIGHCYRCETVIEPYLSDQWFVKMKPLAGPALRVVHGGKIRFHPKRWEKVYEHWMMNIRDWCISRQIWWGHRIPVWNCLGESPKPECTNPIVARTQPDRCPHCGSAKLRQDDDVLDTWFSSWLWPFSTLGWPENTPDLRYFNPTDTLVTAPEIIFFWVARMVMANMEFMKGLPGHDGKPRKNDDDLVPFTDVYFTSIIRDLQGRKMSKSLGNSPDPLDVIDEYGADALRFTVAYLAPLGQDVLFATEKCEIGRNFANKIWNAGRFLLLNKAEICGASDVNLDALPSGNLDLADKWILSRLNHAVKDFNQSLTEFRINETSKILYDFIWHDFCDWYIELAKTRFYGDEPAAVKREVVARALWIFDQALRMLHPVMPFVTEELWQHLSGRNGASIVRAAFPTHEDKLIDEKTEREMNFVQTVIDSIRNIRGENSIPPSKGINLQVRLSDGQNSTVFQTYEIYLKKLARVEGIQFIKGSTKPKLASSAVVEGAELFVPLEGLIDIDAERKRLVKEIARLEQLVEGIERKLGNAQFVERAPKEVVEKEREKQLSMKSNVEKLKKNLELMK